MEHFSYSGGCDVTRVKAYKEELAWATDKWLEVIINVSYSTKELKS